MPAGILVDLDRVLRWFIKLESTASLFLFSWSLPDSNSCREGQRLQAELRFWSETFFLRGYSTGTWQLDKALKLMSHGLLCHGVKELYVFSLKAKANSIQISINERRKASFQAHCKISHSWSLLKPEVGWDTEIDGPHFSTDVHLVALVGRPKVCDFKTRDVQLALGILQQISWIFVFHWAAFASIMPTDFTTAWSWEAILLRHHCRCEVLLQCHREKGSSSLGLQLFYWKIKNLCL